VNEVQLRGGAGDKGRDVLVWLDPSNVTPRRCRLYQCKHYADALGRDDASTEVGKILHYTFTKQFTVPQEYWFVTHEGITNTLQDLIDDPAAFRKFVIENWYKYCSAQITSKATVHLTGAFLHYVEQFDFSIFHAKQPHDLIDEHRQTRFHLRVFGAPLIDRPPPPAPPSHVAAAENGYIVQLYEVIGKALDIDVTTDTDFAYSDQMLSLYNRSRITFYSAEGLKELARDQMADVAFFESLLTEFFNGLYHDYNDPTVQGLKRLRATVKAAQALQLGGHVLNDHTTTNDREGVCHHLANSNRIRWCEP
jgi:hypothetical protein